MKVQFHPEAFDEMLASARFYEKRVAGLGVDFLAAIEQTTHRIQEFPSSGFVEKKSIRRRLVIGFPFAVLYATHRDSHLRRRDNASSPKTRVLAKTHTRVSSPLVMLRVNAKHSPGMKRPN